MPVNQTLIFVIGLFCSIYILLSSGLMLKFLKTWTTVSMTAHIYDKAVIVTAFQLVWSSLIRVHRQKWYGKRYIFKETFISNPIERDTVSTLIQNGYGWMDGKCLCSSDAMNSYSWFINSFKVSDSWGGIKPLNHWGRVTYICVSTSYQHWFR